MSGSTNPLLGVWRLARGRADGMTLFGATPQSFLASLAPLIAFPLVGAMLVYLQEGPVLALRLLALAGVAQLAPPVLSHAVAAWWDRKERWLQYATAYNWCCWALPVMLVVLTTALGVLASATGLPEMDAAQAVVVLLAAYTLWLHWFVARHGLALSRWRAAGLVALVNTGSVALVLGPRLLA